MGSQPKHLVWYPCASSPVILYLRGDRGISSDTIDWVTSPPDVQRSCSTEGGHPPPQTQSIGRWLVGRSFIPHENAIEVCGVSRNPLAIRGVHRDSVLKTHKTNTAHDIRDPTRGPGARRHKAKTITFFSQGDGNLDSYVSIRGWSPVVARGGRHPWRFSCCFPIRQVLFPIF